MSGITTHVLDTARGRPAANLAVALLRQEADGEWGVVGRATTNADGRATALLPEGIPVSAARYRLVFDTGAWLSGQGIEAFFPQVEVEFEVRDADRPHHVPLLLSPYGYSTYRGS